MSDRDTTERSNAVHLPENRYWTLIPAKSQKTTAKKVSFLRCTLLNDGNQLLILNTKKKIFMIQQLLILNIKRNILKNYRPSMKIWVAQLPSKWGKLRIRPSCCAGSSPIRFSFSLYKFLMSSGKGRSSLIKEKIVKNISI